MAKGRAEEKRRKEAERRRQERERRQTVIFAINESAKEGSVSKVKEILASDPWAVNARDKNSLTPLHYAAGRGHLAMVKLLVRRGAKSNARDKDGDTPLALASDTGRPSRDVSR